MKGKTFLILLLATGILAALWVFRFTDEKRTGGSKMGGNLFTELPVNEVTTVTIADSENAATLIKGAQVWQVEERSGYPADFDKIRDTVVKLSRLKIGRSFAGSPDSLARLSLMPPSASDTSTGGKQITLSDASGKILADVIVGQTREGDGGRSGGQYLKKVDADIVFLVDGSFQFLKTAPAQWLEKEILDIKADEVASVACYTRDPRTPIYTLSRPKKGEAARMTPVPPGRNADSAKIDQVLDALAPLTLDDVSADDGKPPSAVSELPRLVYHLYDGRQVSIVPASDGQDSFTLRVAVEDSMVETKDADPSEAKPADGQTSEGETAAADQPPARLLNETLSQWIFSVKKWQFDDFITQPEILLEAVKKEGEGSS